MQAGEQLLGLQQALLVVGGQGSKHKRSNSDRHRRMQLIKKKRYGIVLSDPFLPVWKVKVIR
jgi:hypothetical protein